MQSSRSVEMSLALSRSSSFLLCATLTVPDWLKKVSGTLRHQVLLVLITVDCLFCREDFHAALNRGWGGCDKKISDRKMNHRKKMFFAPIFLSLVFLSPVFLSPGFDQSIAAEARAGYSDASKVPDTFFNAISCTWS